MLHFHSERCLSLATRYLDTKPVTQTAKHKSINQGLTQFLSGKVEKTEVENFRYIFYGIQTAESYEILHVTSDRDGEGLCVTIFLEHLFFDPFTVASIFLTLFYLL